MKSEIANKLHKLYMIAFGQFSDMSKASGYTLKALAKGENYSGKVLRRGTPGAFGWVMRPSRGAKTDRRGCAVGGNSRDRRFARRHPQHFTTVQ